jgi:hypothetical protein
MDVMHPKSHGRALNHPVRDPQPDHRLSSTSSAPTVIAESAMLKAIADRPAQNQRQRSAASRVSSGLSRCSQTINPMLTADPSPSEEPALPAAGVGQEAEGRAGVVGQQSS